ncbi:solute carrier family 46 member 2-like [Syngnathoides biaculeatus]|uniref:solute carrier family 46 member 2-like n=1 Tax=Syngnathoides biaculeatus TaxID=300417 RepID=UPI002ADD5D5C|nr:solute carrier family 46 member 2-like [Syngnathoides biaculeatus]
MTGGSSFVQVLTKLQFRECTCHSVTDMHRGHLLWGIQLVATGVQLGNAFFLTILPMVIKERYVNATSQSDSNLSRKDDGWQVSVSSFFMTYRVLNQLVPILPGLFLAWLGDTGWRKSLIALPLLGLTLSRLVVLFMLILNWPLKVLWVEVVLTGLCGGSTVFWSGVMTLLSLSSTGRDRSKLLMRAEFISGLSGVVGSLTAGHLYDFCSSTLRPGVVTLLLCFLLHASCMLYVIFFLQRYIPTQVGALCDNQTPNKANDEPTCDHPRKFGNIILLWLSGVLYNAVDSSTRNILVLFQLMEPLHWNVIQVGYGNASGFLIALSSFLSSVVLSRWLSDRSLITIGLLSNAAGMLPMAFATTTYMFVIARALTLFSLMPVPFICSLLSQQVHGSSYSKLLISLQLSLKISSAGTNLLYAKIYKETFNWFPGLVLVLSSLISTLAIIPIRYPECIMCTNTHSSIPKMIVLYPTLPGYYHKSKVPNSRPGGQIRPVACFYVTRGGKSCVSTSMIFFPHLYQNFKLSCDK